MLKSTRALSPAHICSSVRLLETVTWLAGSATRADGAAQLGPPNLSINLVYNIPRIWTRFRHFFLEKPMFAYFATIVCSYFAHFFFFSVWKRKTPAKPSCLPHFQKSVAPTCFFCFFSLLNFVFFFPTITPFATNSCRV